MRRAIISQQLRCQLHRLVAAISQAVTSADADAFQEADRFSFLALCFRTVR